MLLKALFSISLTSGLAYTLLIWLHNGIMYDSDRLRAMMLTAGPGAPVNAYLLVLVGALVAFVLTMRNQPKLAIAAFAAFGVPFSLGVCVLLAGPLLNSSSLLGVQAAICLSVFSTASFLATFAVLYVNLFSGLFKLIPVVLTGFRR